MEFEQASYNRSLNPAMSNPEHYWPDRIEIPKNEWLFSLEEIHESPSVSEGMKYELELANYQKYKNRILKAASDLQLPKVVIFYTMIYFYRFFQRRPMQRYQCTVIALSCLYVASKKLENSRSSKSVALVSARIALNNPNIGDESRDYWHWRDFLKNGEEDVLEVLCFDLKISNPYAFFADNLDDTNEYHELLRRKSLSALEVLTMCQIYLVFDTERIFIAVAILTAIEIKGTLPTRFLDFALDPLEVLEIKETWESFAEYDRSLKEKTRAHFTKHVEVADIERLISGSNSVDLSVEDSKDQDYVEENSSSTRSRIDEVEDKSEQNGNSHNDNLHEGTEIPVEIKTIIETEGQDNGILETNKLEDSEKTEKGQEEEGGNLNDAVNSHTKEIADTVLEGMESTNKEDDGVRSPKEELQTDKELIEDVPNSNSNSEPKGLEISFAPKSDINQDIKPDPGVVDNDGDVKMENNEGSKSDQEKTESKEPISEKLSENDQKKVSENSKQSDAGSLGNVSKERSAPLSVAKKSVFGGSQRTLTSNSSVFFQKPTRQTARKATPSKKTQTDQSSIIISNDEAHKLEKKALEPISNQAQSQSLSKKHPTTLQDERSIKRFQNKPVSLLQESSASPKPDKVSKEPITPTLQASRVFGSEQRTPVQLRNLKSSPVTPKQSKVFGSKNINKTATVDTHQEDTNNKTTIVKGKSKANNNKAKPITEQSVAEKSTPKLPKAATALRRRSSTRISRKEPVSDSSENRAQILSMIDSDLSDLE